MELISVCIESIELYFIGKKIVGRKCNKPKIYNIKLFNLMQKFA